jgi:predicted permease
MSISSVIQVLLPTLVPIAVGYAVARWIGVATKPLATLLRYVFFPALLFTVVQGRMAFSTFLLLAATGAAMAGVGLLLVRNAGRFLKPQVDSSAATLNIACFSIPFLALSWAANGLGTACALFAGVALVLFLVESNAKALLREPWLYAVVAALLFQGLGISLPWLDKMLTPFARAAYVVLLLFLGTALHPWVSFRNAEAWATVGVRMVSGFAVGLLAVAMLPFSAAIAEGVILTALAPPATRSMALAVDAEESQAARAAASLGVVVSLAVILFLLVSGWKPWRV